MWPLVILSMSSRGAVSEVIKITMSNDKFHFFRNSPFIFVEAGTATTPYFNVRGVSLHSGSK